MDERASTVTVTGFVAYHENAFETAFVHSSKRKQHAAVEDVHRVVHIGRHEVRCHGNPRGWSNLPPVARKAPSRVNFLNFRKQLVLRRESSVICMGARITVLDMRVVSTVKFHVFGIH